MSISWLLYSATLLVLGGGILVGIAAPGDHGRRVLVLCGVAGLVGSVQSILALAGAGFAARGVQLPGFTSLSPLMDLGVQESALSAFFLLLVCLVGGVLSVASVGYLDRYVKEHREEVALLWAGFFLCLILVVSAGTVFLFLVAWEGMTLLSYFLVIHEHADPGARRAGQTYLLMSHGATAALLFGFLILAAPSGNGSFTALASTAGGLDPTVRSAAFLAFLVGFGTKAGLVPLHRWLPAAHPAAPSNVSALMSGVMIKMGVYGFVLAGFVLLGPGPVWWGYLVVGVGAVSVLVGVLYAIAEHDLKKLLAFHSIENLGIIFLAVGTALLFWDSGFPALAALALAAALFHSLNHALFKGLLFLGGGAVVGEAGTRDMEQYGGMIRSMPVVGATFLVGALAISALPPFNGFVSEWLLFHAFFASFSTGSQGMELVLTLAAAILALAGGLAAYCFVKAFAVTFLARPRSPAAGRARDPPPSLRAGVAFLASACLLLGVLPGIVLGLLASPLTELTGASVPVGEGLAGWADVTLPSGAGSSMVLGLVALLMAGGVGLTWGLYRRSHPGGFRTERAWDCGLEPTPVATAYTALGYGSSIVRLAPGFYRPRERKEYDVGAAAGPVELRRIRAYSVQIGDPIRHYLYAPVVGAGLAVARQVGRLQSGRIRAYLTYLFLTLLALLVWVRFAGGGV